MNNQKQMVWFGMFLGLSSSLLGCPPAAKSPEESKQSGAHAAGDAGAAPAGEEKAGQAAPAPGGGW